MTVSISGTGGVTFNDNSVQDTAATGFGFKNRIINGAMVIDQRNAGASVAVTTSDNYTVDRWLGISTSNSRYTVQQNAGSVTPPSGFVNYLGVTSVSSGALGASDIYAINQYIEGFNVADFNWGTASAQAVTLSFWVRSSMTGTFGGALNNSGSPSYRSYPFAYTISAANTWEYKTITIAGDTSGTWLATNGVGIRLRFGLGIGSTASGTAGAWATGFLAAPTGATSVVGTSGATFYITGVQLEKGSTATSFDYRPYGAELGLCQRYALMIKNGTNSIDRLGLGSTVSATTVQMLIQHPVAFRAAPTLTTTGTAADYQVYSVAVTACNAAPTLGEGSQFNSRLNFITAGGLTGGQVSQCSGANTNAYLLFSAEL